MVKRSPRYPRQSLWKSIEMVQKLFHGAHRAKVDVDAAARVIGYSSSSGGAAASAIGALRQYGLVDGLRGEVSVSELAMRILQPLNPDEKYQAVKEAAGKPEIYSRILEQFGSDLPKSDEALRAYLIRNEGFSVGGTNDLLSALRETFDGIPPDAATLPQPGHEGIAEENGRREVPDKILPESSSFSPSAQANNSVLVLPLGAAGIAELRFGGALTPNALARLIRHLELLKETLIEDQEAM